MSIGRLIKKVTSILLIVAMVMTSAGVHTLANSSLTAVEMNDTAGAKLASPEEYETTVVTGDSVGASDTVGANFTSPEEENSDEKENVKEEALEEKENAEDNSVEKEEEPEEETTAEKESESVGASSASPIP